MNSEDSLAVGETGLIRVDDQVGGQGRSGNFAAYEGRFVGSDRYVIGDVMGKDTEVKVEAGDHVVKLVERYSAIVQSGKVDDQWPERTLACHRVMAALFESAAGGCEVVGV